MGKVQLTIGKLRAAIAVVIATLAAALFKQGWEEVAAIIWLFALILVLPMWSQSR
jgi:hypothetical protein